jgi:hypothetical protein
MITVNIIVPDSLDNRSSGKCWCFSTNVVCFNNKTFKNSQSWTPLDRQSTIIKKAQNTPLQVQLYQFPILPAEAISIHKSQGLTFEK